MQNTGVWRVVRPNNSPVSDNVQPPSTALPKEESWGEYIPRMTAGFGETAVKTLVDMPGNILQAGVNASIRGQNIAQENLPSLKGDKLSEVKVPSLHDKTSKKVFDYFLPKDYTKPQGPGEEIAHEVVSDIASMMIPIGPKLPLKAIIGSIGGGNLAKVAAKEFGAEDNAADFLKTTAMILGTTAGTRQKISAQNSRLYNKTWAPSVIPEGQTGQISKLANPYSKWKHYADNAALENKQGQFVKKALESIDKVMPQGLAYDPTYQANLKDLDTLKKSFNDILFNQPVPGKAAKRMLKDVTNGINGVMYDYGKTNKQFDTMYRTSNKVHSALSASNYAGQTIGDFLQSKKYTSNFWANLGVGLLGKTAGPTFRAPASILKSKEIAKIYGKTIEAALTKNPGFQTTILNNTMRLDKLSAKEDSKDESQDMNKGVWRVIK